MHAQLLREQKARGAGATAATHVPAMEALAEHGCHVELRALLAEQRGAGGAVLPYQYTLLLRAYRRAAATRTFAQSRCDAVRRAPHTLLLLHV